MRHLWRRLHRVPVIRQCILWLSLAWLSGCASLVSSATADLSEGLTQAVMNNEDLDGVRDGAPAFLLLLDGLLAKDPDNVSLLRAGAALNGAYASAFVENEKRQILLIDKSLGLALRAACLTVRVACGARSQSFDRFTAWVNKIDRTHIEVAYALGAAWAGWIQMHSSDWNAIAELSRPKAIMQRIADLDPSYEHGGALLYLGVFETLLPPAMGGRPEVARQNFERAIELSEGKHLLAKVLFAERYARLLFDRDLHDRLLEDVLETDPRLPGLTLLNLVAQEEARKLLATADEYF